MKKNSFFKNGIKILTGGLLFGEEPLLGKMVARDGLLSLEDATISGSLKVTQNVTGSAFTGSFYGDGSNLKLTNSQITNLGNLDISGSIIPTVGNTWDLGSAGNPWRDLYLSGSTLYLGNTKFTRNADGDVELTDNEQIRKKIIVDSVEISRGDKTVILNVDSNSGLLSTLDKQGEPLVTTVGSFSGSFTGIFEGDGGGLNGVVNTIFFPIGNSNNVYDTSSFQYFSGSIPLFAGEGITIQREASKLLISAAPTILEALSSQKINISGSTGNNLVIATDTGSLQGEASLSFDNGTLYVTGTVSASYFSGDGSGLYNIPISRLTGSYRVFQFNEVSESTFTHGLNTSYPLVQVYDSQSNQIVPEAIRAIDSSSVYIHFGSFLETGHVIIGAGGDIINLTQNISTISGSETFKATFAGVKEYSIIHNFDTENVIVSVYDQDKNYFIPSSIKVISPNRVDLGFVANMTGYAVVVKAGHVVSGSVVAADWNGLYNIPAGLFSSSAQIVINESQIADLSHYTDEDVKNKLNSEGVISGSSQITEMGTLTVSGSILPHTNEAFDLGSNEKRWKDLYLSGSTLYLGETKITRTETGDIEFKDANNSRKKLIADSIELRSNNRVIKLEVDTDGQLKTADTNNQQTITTTGNFSGSFTGSFIGDGSQLSGVTSYTNTDTLNYINSVGVISGSAQLTRLGNITLSGSVIPALDNTYDLGSPTRTWRDVYISSGSLYIDGTKVLSSTSDILTITTDIGQSLKILESGADDITLQTDTGNIELKGTVEILSGKKILDSAGNQVVIGDNLHVEGNITLSGNVDGIDLQTFSSSVDNRIKGISTNFNDITNKPTLISSSNQLAGETINGDLTISGILTAQEFRAEFIESAIIYESGSTKFGNSSDDVHQLTGSVCVAGTVSATSFTGDGSGLTGVTSYTDSDTLTYINSKGVVSGSTQIDYNSIQNKPTIPTNNSQLTNGCGYTTCTGTVTSVGGTGTVNGISLSGTVSSTGNLTLGGTLSGITVSQLAGGAIQTSAEAFSDSDTTLMTAAAIADKIESYGYCTTDTNTTYSATTMLSCISSVDGGGSGLDADLLDGQQGSYYLDWNNFSNKPTIPTNTNQLTNGAGYTTCTGTVGGSGTSGYISKWNGSTSQTNSVIYDNGTNVGIGTTSPSTKLHIYNSQNSQDVQLKLENPNTGTSAYVEFTLESDADNMRLGTTSAAYPNWNGDSFIYASKNIRTNTTILPVTNGTQNLGSSTLRWNTVYTSDLSLKNDIGDWTIVEGEDDLFLYNNKRDKVYKFNLTEVDKETAPKKRS